MFYEYRQNNSGGSFDLDESRGISVHVIVEADSPLQADAKAQDIGLYFDGCDDGRDCDCCGDRWYSQANGWGSRDGDEVPSIYGQPLESYEPSLSWTPDDFPEVFVHHKDGTVTGHILG